MTRLDQFLQHNIDGYLAYDFATMSQDDANGQGVGYPLLMTAAAGIEFLGALLSTQPFEPRGQSQAYFVSYWRDYLYPSPSPLSDFAAATYTLVRCGLAHSFVLKGQIGILRHRPDLHFKRDVNGTLIIDAVQLAADVIHSYRTRVKPLLSDPASAAQKALMANRLAEMETAYGQQASGYAVIATAPQVPITTHVGAAPTLGGAPSSSVSVTPPAGPSAPWTSSS